MTIHLPLNTNYILLFNKHFPVALSKADGKVKFQIWAGDVPVIRNSLVVTVDVNTDFVVPYLFACETDLRALF
jgi:hypothetical protein